MRINGKRKAESHANGFFFPSAIHFSRQPKRKQSLMCGLCLCVTRAHFQRPSIHSYAMSRMFEKRFFRKCEKLIPDFITYDRMAIQSPAIMEMVAKSHSFKFHRRIVSHVGHAHSRETRAKMTTECNQQENNDISSAVHTPVSAAPPAIRFLANALITAERSVGSERKLLKVTVSPHKYGKYFQ